MGTLDDVMAMKRQGFADQDIANELSQQGVSPREINDALKQAQIKNAVSDYDYGQGEPSVMQGEEMIPSPEQGGEYVPQEAQQQQYYQPVGGEGYEQQQQYTPGQTSTDTDTVMEIADQIFSDRIKKFQKVLDATSEAAILLQSKFENLSERLKKIETTIDKLQIAILDKVGSYGQNLESIKKEMSMMSDSFSKMVSPRESRRQAETQESSEEELEGPKRVVRKK
jgi:hypothetical protein